MKTIRNTVICLTLLLSFNSFAQSVFPDATQLQKWEVLSTSWGTCYTTILKNGNAVNFCQNQFIEIFSCDENEQNCSIIGYYTLRNDSVILRKNMNCNDPELMMYTFNTLVGDTLQCATNHNPLSDFWVINKQPLPYEGILRSTLSLEYWPFYPPMYTPYQMKWIEGIGSNVHPFYPLTCLGGGGCELYEYVKNVHLDGQLIYQDTTFHFPCQTSSNQDLIQRFGVTVFPNPVDQSFSIQSRTVNALTMKATLYNNIGQQMAVLDAIQLDELIDVSHLPTGVYLLRMETEKGSGSQKILIQR